MPLADDLHNAFTTTIDGDTITTTDSNKYQWIDSGTYYPPNQTVQMPTPDPFNGKIDCYNPKKERRAGMETLYQVIVVSKDREVLLDEMVVADNADEAKLGIEHLHAVLRAKKLKLKDVTILATELGDVKVRKEVQKVKIVDKEEE